MLFDLIFVALFVSGWAVAGGLPWLVLSVATRGRAGLQYLPLCMFAGLVAGLAVPIFGLVHASGIWISFVAAVMAPALLLVARRFSLRALPRVRAGSASQERTQE